MREAQQKVAVITGSTKGIGKAVAQSLAEQGVNVVITSRHLDHAQELAEEINRSGHNVVGFAFDITQHEHLDALLAQTVEHFGGLDILVNNAVSQNCLIPSGEFDDAQIAQTITENITHSYLLCQKSFPYLRQTQGNILNIGSVVVNRHLLGVPLYTLVKGAIIQMTKVLAAEWAAQGVRVNAINPGFVRTSAFADMGMTEQEIDQCYAFYADYQPLAGVGKPQSIAEAATFLTSSAAAFVTGAVLDIDGAYSVKGYSLSA